MGPTRPGKDCQAGMGSKSGSLVRAQRSGRSRMGIGDEGTSLGDAGVGSSALGTISRQWAGVLPGPPLVTKGSLESQRNSGSVAGTRPRQDPFRKADPLSRSLFL